MNHFGKPGESNEDLLKKAGFRSVEVTTAYEDSNTITEDDGMVFTCHK